MIGASGAAKTLPADTDQPQNSANGDKCPVKFTASAAIRGIFLSLNTDKIADAPMTMAKTKSKIYLLILGSI